MTTISIPIERLVFGNEHWRSYRAIDELKIYCDLLELLQNRIDSLDSRGASEEVTLVNVQAVISSYAVEIALKSLWALDNSPDTVPHTHNLLTILDGLTEGTRDSLKNLQLWRDELQKWPTPFAANRYSMECGTREVTVYDAQFLRSVIQLLEDRLEEVREMLIRPPQAPTA